MITLIELYVSSLCGLLHAQLVQLILQPLKLTVHALAA